MSELRREPIVGRWVIVDTDHPNRPEDFEYEPINFNGGICPFCYGNESMTPPEIDVIRHPNTLPNSSGWQVRVVANKFPALQIEGDLIKKGIGLYDMSNGIGAHEIVIETPYHHKDIPELVDSEIENFIFLYCRRAQDLAHDKRFKYVLIFKNYGAAAGATMEHPHSQIIALPMVPKNVQEELRGSQGYFEFKERCIFCDIARQEIYDKARIVVENEAFIAFCPFVSRFPFEIWILPKKHNPYFCKIGPEEKSHLAKILKICIGKVKKLFPHISYNYLIHSSPINGLEVDYEWYHWHIEFIPKLTRVAGFEWGTGFYAVSTPPESAAQFLREVVV